MCSHTVPFSFHIHIRADVHRLALAKIGAGQTSLDWEGSKLPFSGKSLEPEYPGHLHCGWSYALMLVVRVEMTGGGQD